ncbi:MAG: hypothetical protein OEV42_21365, partial [Deltaproteobacteria bacterium]|nr:hypothetical protein [Deltaproteobacteria bacterium]
MGYTPRYESPTGFDDTGDQPVRSAMVRNGNMVAFSNGEGKYAILDYQISDTCLYASPMTARHPLTGKVV